MGNWDDNEKTEGDGGRSFGGQGRGFKPVDNNESNDWSGNNQRDGFGEGRRGRGGGGRGGRGGRFDGNRDGRRDYDNGDRGGDNSSWGGNGDRREGRGRFNRDDNDDRGGGWNNDDGRFGGDNKREGRGRFNRDDNDDRGGGWKKDDGGFGGDKKGEDGDKERPPIYVPKEKTEEELWADSGVSKGINFKDYKDIQVKVTGDNPPKKINSFNDAQFRDLLMSNLKKCHYEEPTPVQQWAIPIIMDGRDLMATAQTGSGKTAAYLLPTMHMVLNENYEYSGGACAPQILVLSPTRELAIQIHDVAKKFAQGSYLKVRLLYGGTSMGHQNRQLQDGCNVLVATPGRLKDFVNRGNLDFSGIKFLILDEADRMLDMGFIKDIEVICSHSTMTSKEVRQTLMFSATFSSDVQLLAHKYLEAKYLFLAIGIVGGACKDVKQRFIEVPRSGKKQKLKELLDNSDDVRGTLLFVETKRTADFIASYLSSSDFPTTSIHGDRFQSQREQALRDFKSNTMKILVATAVAARGLDISGVQHVINYDLPESIDEYVHRIGRTGRLGNKGLATSFFDPDNDSMKAAALAQILEQAGQEIPDFLMNGSGGGVGFSSNGGFGGTDCRENSSGANEEEAW